MRTAILLVTCVLFLPAGETAVGEGEAAFIARCAEQAAAAEEAGKRVVALADDWLFLRNELRHLGVGPFWGEAAQTANRNKKPEWRDPLPAILDVQQQCGSLGIELVVVIIPTRALVYADKVLPEVPKDEAGIPQRMDPHHRAFYAVLREGGVEVIDLTDAFLAARQDDAELGPVCCRTDSHWAPRGAAIAAKAIADRFRDKDWAKARAGKPEQFPAVTEELTITGDLKDGVEDAGKAQETLPVTRVSYRPDGEEAVAVPDDDTSPLLLLADSHGLVFGAGEELHCTRGALPDLLAKELTFPVDGYFRRAGAASSLRLSLARDFYAKDGYRDGKKALVWCIKATDFTEATDGWRKIDLTLKK